MKVFYSLYDLEAYAPVNSATQTLKRPGALLKVWFEEGRIGYADCHAWPELGDLPLQKQLDLLAADSLTPITSCALECAKIDADARLEGKAILNQSSIPKSHYLVTNLCSLTACQVQRIVDQGFTHVKLKVGRQTDAEGEAIHSLFHDSSLKLRLDFNECLTPVAFRCFVRQMEALKTQIDFIEDPFPFQPEDWKVFQQEGWRLACDRQAAVARRHPESASILIVKPAIQLHDEWEISDGQTCIVTSYLGHPLGQAAAAFTAASLDPSGKFVHGLLSHHAYFPTVFSHQLNWAGPAFTVPQGHGFGFDNELKSLKWSPLT